MATDEEFLDGLLEKKGGNAGMSGEGAPEGTVGSGVSDEWLTHIDDLFAQADEQAKEKSLSSDGGEENDETLEMFDENISFLNADFELADFENMDVTQIIDSMEKAGSDLEEINGLLKNVDQNINITGDMPSSPENNTENQTESTVNGSNESSGNDSGEAFDIFAESSPEEGAEDETSAEEEDGKARKKGRKEKRDKKKKAKLFGKGKQEQEEVIKAAPVQEDVPVQEEESADELLGDLPGADQREEEPEKEKKPGLFSRMMNYLTAEEEEPAEDENSAILKELDEEDKKAKKDKKSKKKDKKKGKKGKKGKEGAEQAEGEEGAEEETAKPKKEKKKKEKKPKEESGEKPVKVLSRKNMLLLIAFCATLITCIVTLSTFLPEYSDKEKAREAFYAGDYDSVYQLLYNKRLDSNDTVIFNRVKSVLKYERKLKSYENNLALGRELEAVHSLIQGVVEYQDIQGADEYGARNEIDAIYQQICSILEEKYGITSQEALEINSYDNVEYTKKLDSVVNGTDYTAPGEEKEEEPVIPQDILPDEEEIISY